MLSVLTGFECSSKCDIEQGEALAVCPELRDKGLAMRLDSYLIKNDIPVEQFAKKIGVHRTTVYRFMNGGTFPRAETLRRIRDATGGKVVADDFVDQDRVWPPKRIAAG